jgi:hypothetical protein
MTNNTEQRKRREREKRHAFLMLGHRGTGRRKKIGETAVQGFSFLVDCSGLDVFGSGLRRVTALTTGSDSVISCC